MRRVAMCLLLLALAAGAAASLPTINDDYAKARAAAIQRRLPIFVEVWAQW